MVDSGKQTILSASGARGGTLYTPSNIDELKAYTLRLLNLLEKEGCLKSDVFENWRDRFLDSNGNVDWNGAENALVEKHLEFMSWNGHKYYFCSMDNCLYTYSKQPVKIGYFDYDTMTPVIL